MGVSETEVKNSNRTSARHNVDDVIDCTFSIEGDGPPLFLIHGIGAARNAWPFLLPVLSKYFTVVAYDLRGHGESPIPDGEFGLDELVSDLEHVREKTGIERNPRQGQSGFITTVLCFTLSAGDRRTEDGGLQRLLSGARGKVSGGQRRDYGGT